MGSVVLVRAIGEGTGSSGCGVALRGRVWKSKDLQNRGVTMQGRERRCFPLLHCFLRGFGRNSGTLMYVHSDVP